MHYNPRSLVERARNPGRSGTCSLRWLWFLGLVLATTSGAGWSRVAFAADSDPVADSRTAAEQVMHVDVWGAVAAVTVTRTLRHCDGLPWTQARARGECVLDIVLPRGSALTQVRVRDPLRHGPARSAAGDASRPLERYRDALRAVHLEPSSIPFDDDASYRLRVLDTSTDPERFVDVEYVFVAPLELVQDRAVLSFPPSPELSPPETRVEIVSHTASPVAAISFAGRAGARGRGTASAVSGSFVAAATGTVSTRTGWRIELTLGRGGDGDSASAVPGRMPPPSPAASGTSTRIAALASFASGRSGGGARAGKPRVVVAVGVRPGGVDPLPDRVLFVIDRSRSVGAGGLEAERDLALQILGRLPPSTRFDAVFFDRRAARLFPVARTATRQAMSALADQLVPDRLANGTELATAMEFANNLLRGEASDFGPRVLVAVLTDGAVGAPAGQSPEHGRALHVEPPLPEVAMAVISIRPDTDPPVSDEERARLQALASRATAGAVEATVRAGDPGQALDRMFDELRAGGGVFAVGLAMTGSRALPLASALEPGQGIATRIELENAPGALRGVAATPRARGAETGAVHFQYRATRMSVPLRATRVPDALLAPLFTPISAAPVRSWVFPHRAVLWEPVVRPSANASEDSPTATPGRGFLERSVLRDALSMAYTPRARACYLTRSARTAAERDLSGRVRVALDIRRGEMVAASILSSTLAHPAIEACLREAAFVLELPRAFRNDDLVTAVLNLVFRPRTPEPRRPTERSEFDRELELVIESAAPDSVDQPDGGTDRGAGDR